MPNKVHRSENSKKFLLVGEDSNQVDLISSIQYITIYYKLETFHSLDSLERKRS